MSNNEKCVRAFWRRVALELCVVGSDSGHPEILRRNIVEMKKVNAKTTPLAPLHMGGNWL